MKFQPSLVITRKKARKDRTEESVIDLVIVSEDIVPVIKSMIVDDKRKHMLTRISKSKGVVTVVKSDHPP